MNLKIVVQEKTEVHVAEVADRKTAVRNIRSAIIKYTHGIFDSCEYRLPSNSTYGLEDWKFLKEVSTMITSGEKIKTNICADCKCECEEEDDDEDVY